MLYFNSEIWNIPLLKPYLKNLLLSTSAKALYICTQHYDPMMSFKELYTQNAHATPAQFMIYMIYKHALLLHSVYNNQTQVKIGLI